MTYLASSRTDLRKQNQSGYPSEWSKRAYYGDHRIASTCFRLYLSKLTHPEKAAPTWQKALAAWLKFWPFPLNPQEPEHLKSSIRSTLIYNLFMNYHSLFVVATHCPSCLCHKEIMAGNNRQNIWHLTCVHAVARSMKLQMPVFSPKRDAKTMRQFWIIKGPFSKKIRPLLIHTSKAVAKACPTILDDLVSFCLGTWQEQWTRLALLLDRIVIQFSF